MLVDDEQFSLTNVALKIVKFIRVHHFKDIKLRGFFVCRGNIIFAESEAYTQNWKIVTMDRKNQENFGIVNHN